MEIVTLGNGRRTTPMVSACLSNKIGKSMKDNSTKVKSLVKEECSTSSAGTTKVIGRMANSTDLESEKMAWATSTKVSSKTTKGMAKVCLLSHNKMVINFMENTRENGQRTSVVDKVMSSTQTVTPTKVSSRMTINMDMAVCDTRLEGSTRGNGHATRDMEKAN